jgi:LPS O-antigen subunit length determinant protein (WzzB/FepE family)
MSLFGGKKKEDGDSNGVVFGGKTVHPSAVHSAADKGFLDLEEEMAVALTERVEKLSEEKGRLEDEMILLTRQLEQEKIIAAQLRQQLKLEGKLDTTSSSSSSLTSTSSSSTSDSSSSKQQQKKDKLVLSPENTAKVLTETIARNRELEEVKKEQDREVRRLRQQLEVKRQELKEALRLAGKAGINSTQAGAVKSRSNSALLNNTGGGSTKDIKTTLSPHAGETDHGGGGGEGK